MYVYGGKSKRMFFSSSTLIFKELISNLSIDSLINMIYPFTPQSFKKVLIPRFIMNLMRVRFYFNYEHILTWLES